MQILFVILNVVSIKSKSLIMLSTSNLFRKTLMTAVLTLPMLSLSPQDALASDRRNFDVINNNELEITSHLAP